MTTESTHFSFIPRQFSLLDFVSLSSLTLAVSGIATSILKNETFSAIQYAILGISISYFYWINSLNIQQISDLNENIERLEETSNSLKSVPLQIQKEREKIEQQSTKIQLAMETVEKDGEERERQKEEFKEKTEELEKNLTKGSHELEIALECMQKNHQEYEKEIQELKTLLIEQEKKILSKEQELKTKEASLKKLKEKVKHLAKLAINHQQKADDRNSSNV